MLKLRAYHYFFIFLLAVGCYLELAIGEVNISYNDLSKIFTSGSTTNIVLLKLRLPRLLMAIATGSGLALCGYLMQTIFKNPLAGPYILGVSSGAGLTVALFLLSTIGIPILSSLGIPLAAIIGALLILTLLLFFMKKTKSMTTVLIMGVLLGSFSTAIISVLEYFAPQSAVKYFVVWAMGNLQAATLWQVILVMIIVVSAYLVSFILGRKIDLMLLPDIKAFSLGIDIFKTQQFFLILTAIVTGCLVAYSGPIGFVGIIVPHLAAMITQTRLFEKNKFLLPLIGCNIVIFADILSHLPSGFILPINSLLSLFGIPVIFYILITRKTIVA